MAYASGANLLERYDARDIGDLVADDGTQITAVNIPTNTNVLAALNDASGEIDAALMVGNRYAASELSGLTGNSQYHLIRMTCDIAMARIMGRRPGRDIEKLKAMMELAESHLERLRNGENVFNLADQKDAGNPSASGLSAVEYSQSGLIRDRSRNYYPIRNSGTL